MAVAAEWHFWKDPPTSARSWLFRYGLGVLITTFAAALSFRTIDITQDAFLFFFGAVILTALAAGIGPGLVTLSCSIVVLYFLFTPDLTYLPVEEKIREISRLLLFGSVSLVTTLFTSSCRTTRDQLAKREASYRLLAENNYDGLAAVDLSGQILFFNSSCERIFGSPANDYLGRSIFEVIPDSSCKDHFRELTRKWDSRNNSPFRWAARDKTGQELHLEVSVGAFSLPGQAGFVMCIRPRSTLVIGRSLSLLAPEPAARPRLFESARADEVNQTVCLEPDRLPAIMK